MNAIINTGALLDAIQAKGCNGIEDAARLCGVGTIAFNKLLSGKVPRLDTLFKISKGLNLKISAFIVGASRSEPRKKVYRFADRRRV